LNNLDANAVLQRLDRWQADLETAWSDTNSSPPAQIARNADTLLNNVAEGIEREAAKLAGGDPRGLQRALAFFDRLPQLIEEARANTSADDSYYLTRTIPSSDRRLKEIDQLVTAQGPIKWSDVFYICMVFAPLTILIFLFKHDWWLFVLALWMIVLVTTQVARPLRRRWLLLRRRSDFVSALQFKYQALLEREMRTERRGLFDALLAVVRQRRGELLAWQGTVAAAKATLSHTKIPSTKLTFGERLLREPSDFPLPVGDYDQARIEEIAAQYLDPAARPHWRRGDEPTIVTWLRNGAEQALTGWRWAIHVTGWNEPVRSHSLADLMTSARLQWPLSPEENRGIDLNIVGLTERDELVLPGREQQILVVSTSDPSRLSYVPMRHGLRLTELAAIKDLWESLR
jgi:hypothetical protein